MLQLNGMALFIVSQCSYRKRDFNKYNNNYKETVMNPRYFDFDKFKHNVILKPLNDGFCVGPILDQLTPYKSRLTTKQYLECLSLLKMELIQAEVQPFLQILTDLVTPESAEDIYELLWQKNTKGENLLSHCKDVQHAWTKEQFLLRDIKPLVTKLSQCLPKEHHHPDFETFLKTCDLVSRYFVTGPNSSVLFPPPDLDSEQIKKMLATLRKDLDDSNLCCSTTLRKGSGQ